MKILILTAAALVALAVPAAAGAHVVVLPGSSRPAELQRYTVVVPTERNVPTKEVAVKVPAGIDFVLVGQTAGWKAKLEKRGGKPDVVRFTGGSIPADSFADFQLIARNPVREGTLAWKVNQVYADGQSVLWAGAASSDTPGARTRITERAVPTDVVDVESGSAPAAAGAATAAPASSASAAKTAPGSDGRANLALGLGIGALVLALLGLGATFRARRHDPPPAL